MNRDFKTKHCLFNQLSKLRFEKWKERKKNAEIKPRKAQKNRLNEMKCRNNENSKWKSM